MKKDLFKVARRLAVYLLCVSLLFADSSRMGSHAEESPFAMNEAEVTITNTDANVTVEAPRESIYKNSNYNLVFQNATDVSNFKLPEDYYYYGAYLVYLYSQDLPEGVSYDGYSMVNGGTAKVKIPFTYDLKKGEFEVVLADLYQIPASTEKKDPLVPAKETVEKETETGTEAEETETETETEPTTEAEAPTTDESVEESTAESSSDVQESAAPEESVTEESETENVIVESSSNEASGESTTEEVENMEMTVLSEALYAQPENMEVLQTLPNETENLENEKDTSCDETVMIPTEEASSKEETKESKTVEDNGNDGKQEVVEAQTEEVIGVAVPNEGTIAVHTEISLKYEIVEENTGKYLEIQTPQLGTFLIRTNNDEFLAKQKRRTDYLQYLDMPEVENVEYFSAVMYNFTAENVKEKSGDPNAIQFNNGNGKQYYNRNNAGIGDSSGYDSATPGLVEEQLGSDGYPVFTVPGTAPWFDPNAAVADEIYHVSFPFKNENGTYVFDSDKMSVLANEEYYRDEAPITQFSLKKNKSNKIGTFGARGFWPFTKETTENFNEHSLRDRKTDEHFGMKLDVDFMIPETLNQPMEFEFSGDDDVWVFVDGKLVLDVGGIHGKVIGKIDFTNDNVYVSKVVDLDQLAQKVTAPKNESLGQILESAGGSSEYKDGKVHHLTLFYVERGNYASNCMIKFSLLAHSENKAVVVPEKTAKVKCWNDRTYDISIDAKSYYTDKSVSVDENHKFILDEDESLYPTKIENAIIRDVVDSRFEVIAIDDKPVTVKNGVKSVDASLQAEITQNGDYEVVTWKNQATEEKVTESGEKEYSLSHKLTIQAKDTYFGGNDVPTNYNAEYDNPIHKVEDADYISSYIKLINNEVYELDQPLVNVKVADEIEGAFDVIFKGETIGEEIAEDGSVVRYFTTDDLAKYVDIQNGEVVSIGGYTDLRDVDLTQIKYAFYKEKAKKGADGYLTEDELAVEELLKEQPKEDTFYPFMMSYSLKSSGDSEKCQVSMATPDEDQCPNVDTSSYYFNLKNGSLDSSYRIYVYQSQITVTKAIVAKDVNLAMGDPIFTFKLVETETGKTRYQLVRFSDVEQSAEGEICLSATFENLPAGNYELTELKTIRYKLELVDSVMIQNSGKDIYEIKGAVAADVEGSSIIANAVAGDKKATFGIHRPVFEDEQDVIADAENRTITGIATFHNSKHQKDYDSDTDTVVNHFTVNENGVIVITKELDR